MLVLGGVGQDADLDVGQVGVALTCETSAAPRGVSRNSRWKTMMLSLCIAIASPARSASVSAKTMICFATPGSTLSVVTAAALATTTSVALRGNRRSFDELLFVSALIMPTESSSP